MEEGTLLLAELSAMKMRALQRRAVEIGVDEDALEDVEEKSEVIALITTHMEQQKKTDEAAKLAQLKEELSGMKLWALQSGART